MPNNEFLVRVIKQKKELSDLQDSFILGILNSYLKKHDITLKNLKPKEIKLIAKEIRSELRLYSGRFEKSLKNREELLEKNKIKELLETHVSTQERLNYYPKLRKLISSLKIKSILDLGCGLNPIALADSKIKYYAADIKSSELELIKKFFAKNSISGKTFIYDIKSSTLKLPKADICLLLKVLDIIEKKPYKLAEALLKKLKCRYILISFSTKTLSGKKMSYPRRYWLEKLLANKEFSYRTFSSDNEIFYLVEK